MNIKIRGTESPEIYFIEDVNNENNESFKDNDFIISLLSNFGLNDNNCKFMTIIRENNESIIDYSKIYEDIIKSQPKIIITVGGSSSENIIGSEFKRITIDHGKIFDSCEELINRGFNGKIIPVYHPTYISRQQNNKLRIEFKNEIKLAIDICVGAISLSSIKTESYNDNTVICLTYKDFDDFCKSEIDNNSVIAYDIESNALEKTSKDYRIVGFSLASRSNYGCYVVIESLDYKMSDLDKKLVFARMRKILTSKDKIITYNCMHELPATLNRMKIEIKNIDDLFVKVKLLMGNADKYEGNGGLKIQCQMNLNVSDWSEDLDKYFEYLKDFSNCKDKMTGLLLKYYSNDELLNIWELVEHIVADDKTFENPVISYGTVPYKLIGKYGGTDSSILFDLDDYYDRKIQDLNNELGIDLNIGYKYWLEHHIAGYILERNGANWNDKKASEIEEWCYNGMKESLANLIKDDLSQDYIKSKLEDDFYRYVMNNLIDKILGNFAVPKRLYKSSVNIEFLKENSDLENFLKMMSLEPISRKKRDGTVNITRQYKLELGHIKTLTKKYIKDYEELNCSWFKEYMKEFLSRDNIEVSDMTGLLNPTATSEDFRNFVSSILINDDIHYAKFYLNLIEIIEKPYFDINHYDKPYLKDDKRLLELVLKLQVSDMSKSNRLKVIMKFIHKEDISINSRDIQKALNDALSYKLESFNDDYILELFDMYEMTGLNMDNQETWSDSFKWLYNFRRYKKFAKMISTYIYGKVGRKSVWYVDKSSFENGDKLTQREISYYDAKDNIINKDSMDTVLQTDFKVDMADTGRWKATMHTLPAGSTIKGIITSRYKGGVIFCPDCSQAEVRVLAAQSQDQNLIDAFMKDGMDIHRYVGSLVFHGGDMDAVTDTERKIAKGAVFGILYGESEKSFADSFFHGDLNEAMKVFDYFYTAFPGIKDYVSESHQQFDKYKKVILPITNRFLNMEPLALENGDDKDRIYRQSQNFRIQGMTCLSGDTEIRMLDGSSRKIEDLANSDSEEFYVYSYDESRDKIVPSKAILARQTKLESKLIRITLDNNEYVECTLDHRFLKRSGEYVYAQDLKIGDSLMPMYTRYSDKSKGDYINGYEIIKQNDGSEDYTHKLVCDEFNIEVPIRNCHNNEVTKERHRQASIKRESDPNYIFNRVKKELAMYHELNINWKDMSSWDNNKNMLIDKGLIKKGTHRSSKIIDSIIGWNKFINMGVEYLSTYNHKIINIEYISYEDPVPVYDITVPKYNNFVLSSGIVVHNCDLAGLILYNICKYIEEHNLKSKVFCFIHDSIEIDVPPEETFLMADMLKPLFNKYPWDNFKVPMASDIVVGASMGQESDIDILEHDEDYNEVTIKLKGFIDDIDELINIWNEVYDIVEIIDKEVTSSEYVSLRGLFQKKVVINRYMGTTREKGNCKLHIIRKEI